MNSPSSPSAETGAMRLTYGQKLIAEAIEAHFGERVEDYDEDVDDTSNHDAWEAFDAAVFPAPTQIKAGETEEAARPSEQKIIADFLDEYQVDVPPGKSTYDLADELTVALYYKSRAVHKMVEALEEAIADSESAFAGLTPLNAASYILGRLRSLRAVIS